MTDTTTSIESLYLQFAEALALVGGTCHRAENVPSAVDVLAAIVRDDAPDDSSGTVWAAPLTRNELPALLDALGSSGIPVKHPETPAEVRDQPFGLSVARQAIAETGSVVLVERELPDRSVGLMTETHIVICPLDDLTASLDDTGETLSRVAADNGSYATLVTGPSRTADIERQLTVGVQGPARLHVIFVERLD